MLSGCGGAVDYLRTGGGITSAGLSSASLNTRLIHYLRWIKPGLIHSFIPQSLTALSTSKKLVSPLLNRQFYPLSTTPITKTTKQRKERNY